MFGSGYWPRTSARRLQLMPATSYRKRHPWGTFQTCLRRSYHSHHDKAMKQFSRLFGSCRWINTSSGGFIIRGQRAFWISSTRRRHTKTHTHTPQRELLAAIFIAVTRTVILSDVSLAESRLRFDAFAYVWGNYSISQHRRTPQNYFALFANASSFFRIDPKLTACAGRAHIDWLAACMPAAINIICLFGLLQSLCWALLILS